ncbi:hypothetical protein AYL99_11930 [Fonsecaea erecta]|uniref:Uncharacterized protein n=1 Tax=Fonsecaea erecta TaxID=1367422 RepID=A0A178Z278_9EURO|nr:hypothetical protein AYL99_11930 [Fonsecaea erecta]OAP53908.1 hypothetical protein AYL99_11930 [Fonsecaea erecta]
MDLIHRVQAAHADVFSPATLDSSTALTAFRRHGKLLSRLGLEGLDMIGWNASMPRLYHQLGAEYVTLTGPATEGMSGSLSQHQKITHFATRRTLLEAATAWFPICRAVHWTHTSAMPMV